MPNPLEDRVAVLEAAVLGLAAVEFTGDLPGHPFHGTQYKGGEDDARSTYNEARAAGASHDDAIGAVHEVHGATLADKLDAEHYAGQGNNDPSVSSEKNARMREQEAWLRDTKPADPNSVTARLPGVIAKDRDRSDLRFGRRGG